MKLFQITLSAIVLITLLAPPALSDDICVGYGPQTPRDIDDPRGLNARAFSLAPPATQLNLCNIHFHSQAEHRAEDFSLTTADKHGYQCRESAELSGELLAPLETNHCSGIEPGDTIEVHWVYSSCAVSPGEGLGSCLSDSCANPDLRAETQVFLVVNDSTAPSFLDYTYGGTVVSGLHQPKALPADTGAPIEFRGSTTGPSYDEQKCSPLQVTWSVRPQCARVDIASLSRWCQSNVFDEDEAHGVRELVTDPRLLAPLG